MQRASDLQPSTIDEAADSAARSAGSRGGRRVPGAKSLPTAMALSASAGYLDAFTYVGHGKVFASAMTGNMVLLGIHIASRHDVLTYMIPILAFVVGVMLAHVMLRATVRRVLFERPHVVTLFLEIVVLLVVALAPLHLDDKTLVSAITISTAMQNTTFRNVGARTYNSVIMTGNLQAFSNALAGGLWPWSAATIAEALDLLAVIVSFVSGAALGALLSPSLGLHAVLVPAGVLAAGMMILLASRDGAR
jgi:uncharacterized membrane protein YoaK (UPF0700 family)